MKLDGKIYTCNKSVNLSALPTDVSLIYFKDILNLACTGASHLICSKLRSPQ
jgi:hypothetical protein